jgi:hypothetical protein
MPLATLYKASGEVEEVNTPDYFTCRPGIARSEPRAQLGRDSITRLIGALDDNHVEFCESHDGRRIAYAIPSTDRPINPFAVDHCVLPLRGDVIEIDYSNSLND